MTIQKGVGQRKPIRVYADTSVYGGVFDIEFEQSSRIFFEQVEQGLFELVISTLLGDELEKAPERVISLFEKIKPLTARVEVSRESILLQDAYLKAGIVAPKWESDALHVALATVSQCQVLVSWNCKHIVHYGKISFYNAINTIQGYNTIAIHTPSEVIVNDEKDI